MCGYAAFFNFGDRGLLDESTREIAHRGPDFQDIVWFDTNRCGLGHRRLSIIDLSEASNQPFWNDNKTLVIAYNGEIFNYKELRRELIAKGYGFRTESDTEVLLKGYEAYGKEILGKLNGMFSFVIYNPGENTVFAARDHIGIKPLYYMNRSGALIIASEIKSIKIAVPNLEPDYQAIATPAHFQTSPRTGLKTSLNWNRDTIWNIKQPNSLFHNTGIFKLKRRNNCPLERSRKNSTPF